MKKTNPLKCVVLALLTDINSYTIMGIQEKGTLARKQSHHPQVKSRGIGNVVSWLPYGRAFYIRNNNLFGKEILTKYFKNYKTASFSRQINIYGFPQITAGFDNGAYYHVYFLKGKPFLTQNSFRMKLKGTKIRAATSPQDKQDFYLMSPIRASLGDPSKTTLEAITICSYGRSTTKLISICTTEGKHRLYTT